MFFLAFDGPATFNQAIFWITLCIIATALADVAMMMHKSAFKNDVDGARKYLEAFFVLAALLVGVVVVKLIVSITFF